MLTKIFVFRRHASIDCFNIEKRKKGPCPFIYLDMHAGHAGNLCRDRVRVVQPLENFPMYAWLMDHGCPNN